MRFEVASLCNLELRLLVPGITLNPILQASSLFLCTDRFMSDLVVIPNCWLSHGKAHVLLVFSGIVIDLMDAFHPGMYLSGILTILGGLVMILIPVFKKSPSSVVVEVDL